MCQCVMVHLGSYVATRKAFRLCTLDQVEMSIDHELYLKDTWFCDEASCARQWFPQTLQTRGTDADHMEFCQNHCPEETA